MATHTFFTLVMLEVGVILWSKTDADVVEIFFCLYAKLAQPQGGKIMI